MKCSNCGCELTEGSKFCVRCGTSVANNMGVNTVEKKQNNNKGFLDTVLECFMFILNVLLKPVSTLKEKIKNYSDVKSSGILVLVVSLSLTIVNLLSNMISTIFVKKITSYYTGDTKLSIEFDNLKNLDYVDLIFKRFFEFAIFILALAGIYYIVSMIMKKSSSYFRLATISAVSLVPYGASIIISVIVSYIYAPLSFFILFGSLIYSLLTFINAMDEELNIDDSNLKVYFHTICMIVLIIAAYYIALNSTTSAINSLLK